MFFFCYVSRIVSMNLHLEFYYDISSIKVFLYYGCSCFRKKKKTITPLLVFFLCLDSSYYLVLV